MRLLALYMKIIVIFALDKMEKPDEEKSFKHCFIAGGNPAASTNPIDAKSRKACGA